MFYNKRKTKKFLVNYSVFGKNRTPGMFCPPSGLSGTSDIRRLGTELEYPGCMISPFSSFICSFVYVLVYLLKHDTPLFYHSTSLLHRDSLAPSTSTYYCSSVGTPFNSRLIRSFSLLVPVYTLRPWSYHLISLVFPIPSLCHFSTLLHPYRSLDLFLL